MIQNRFTHTQPGRIYFDHNATTPTARIVTEKVAAWLGDWGNPSSIHWSGRGPKNVLRESRATVAGFIGASPLEVIFTASGTESDNLAIRGFLNSSARPEKLQRNRILISKVEHPAVIKTAESLRQLGYVVDYIQVNRRGEMDLEEIANQITDQTALVSVMLANNETGHVFPIKKIAKLAHQKGAFIHCDGVQALGKMLFSVDDLDVDFMSFSAHKFYALRGCGVLFARTGVPFESLMTGGGQERHRRAGTENVLAIRSLSEVCNCKSELPARIEHMSKMRDHFEELALAEISEIQILGQSTKRLGNTSNVLLSDIDGESLLMNLDMLGISVSTGAACSAGNPEPSPVLLAMGLTRAEAQSSLRVSLGWDTHLEEVHQFVDQLKQTVKRLRDLRSTEKSLWASP